MLFYPLRRMFWINSAFLLFHTKKHPFLWLFPSPCWPISSLCLREILSPCWLSPSKLHVPDGDKYSTLHTCGTKILPGEEHGVVVVLGVLRVGALLRVSPAADLLQAAGWVPSLYQAD